MLAAPVGEHVDRRPPAGAGPQRHPLDDVRVGRPLGDAATGWQYRALVRGQVPFVRNTSPSPSGTRSRYGSVLPASGFRAITSSTGASVPARWATPRTDDPRVPAMPYPKCMITAGWRAADR